MNSRNVFLPLVLSGAALLTACSENKGESSSQSSSTISSSSSINQSSSTVSSSSSSSSAAYSLSTNRINLSADEGEDINFISYLELTFDQPEQEPRVEVEFNEAAMVQDVEIGGYDPEAQIIVLTIIYESSTILTPGTHFGDLELSVCSTESCDEAPASVDVIYTINPNQAPTSNCEDLPGVMFSDCIDPTWYGPYAWQMDHDSGRFYHYFDNDGRLLVNWDIVEESPNSSNTLIEVYYSDDNARGQLAFAPPLHWQRNESYDLSLFADGNLQFDVYVESWGENDQELQFAVECGWPCGTGRISLDIPETKVWQRITYPVSTLVDMGLDLHNVTTGFIIGTREDTSATGVHFKLDNIQWSGGEELSTRPETGTFVATAVSPSISNTEDEDTGYVWVVEAFVEGVESYVHYFVDTDNSLLADSFTVENPSSPTGSSRLFIFPIDKHEIGTGTQKGTVSVHACTDSTCSTEFANSPQEVTLIHTLLPTQNSDPGCSGALGDVFIDCIGPAWLDVSSWEAVYGDNQRHYRTFNGEGDFGARWEIINLTDGDHNQVIDFQHGSDENTTNSLQILAAGFQSDATNDLSQYQNGQLQLDVRVLDWGVSSRKLNLTIECIYPCRSHQVDITPQVLGEWSTFTVSTADLIDGGLDISTVYASVSIAPEGTPMAGAHYQIDNIQWTE